MGEHLIGRRRLTRVSHGEIFCQIILGILSHAGYTGHVLAVAAGLNVAHRRG